MAITLTCVWCSTPFTANRQHAKLCGNSCTVAWWRYRKANLDWLTSKEAFDVLSNMAQEGRHPNPLFAPAHRTFKELEADVYAKASEALSTYNSFLEKVIEYGQEEEHTN